MPIGERVHVSPAVLHSELDEQSWNAIAGQEAAHACMKLKPMAPPIMMLAQQTWPWLHPDESWQDPAAPSMPVVASSPESELDPELDPAPELLLAAASLPLPLSLPLAGDPPQATTIDAPHAAAMRRPVTFMEDCPPVAIRGPPRRHPRPRRVSWLVIISASRLLGVVTVAHACSPAGDATERGTPPSQSEWYAALENDHLAHRFVIALAHADHADVRDDSQRSMMPRERGRLHRPDTGLAERPVDARGHRSEEHTSELQSP